MKEYNNLNDYELVSLAQECNEEAYELLHKKYQPLIIKNSKKIYKYVQNKGIELSDLMQECTIGFEEAIKNFNQYDDVTFYTFANVCMERQLLSEIKKLNRKKHQILNEAIPLETIDENDDNINLIDFIKDDSENPELDLFSKESLCEFYQNIEKLLTKFEGNVLKLKLKNYNYKEIAIILNKSEKSIDNSIQRIRLKLEKFISSKN